MDYTTLSKAGLKVTIQRLAILEFLEETKLHPSAETVLKEVQKKYPTITLSTVYNTLETFAKHNIISKVFTPDGKTRYEVNKKKHHHIFIEGNNEIIDYYDEKLDKLIDQYLESKEFNDIEIESFQIEIKAKLK